ncbi:MAG: aminotransferase class V-fold PLP-dependent enzyme [Acidobacteria bacterium]|nr:aminotransferase class V-fold PLP-dependent enzyme [Acidobacteriota bacterium]
MTTSRRELLGVVAGASLLPMLNVGALARAAGQSGGDLPRWVAGARAAIPATRDRFFQTAGIAPSSRSVIDEVKSRLEFQNEGPVATGIADRMAQIEPDLRSHLGAFAGAHADEIALTHSTSEGINIASWALNWKAGDEVVISNQEHPANLIPWYNLRSRFGVVLRVIDLSAGSDFRAQIRAAVGTRTRMVSVPHVSRNNGRALRTDEVAEVARWLRERGVRFHLDGAQGPGCVPFDFGELGCDYYSTCGHKWLLGPKGTGAFFVRADMLDATALTWTGSHSTTAFDYDGNYELIPEARRFEFGTRALATFAGFDAALAWFDSLGVDRVLSRIDELTEYAIETTDGLSGFDVTSPRAKADRSGVFVARLPEGCTAWPVYEALRLQGAYTSPVTDERDLRIAIHFFNTRDEIRSTLLAVDDVCRREIAGG